MSKQHTDLPRFLFTEDPLKIKKGLELVYRPHFSWKFLIKKFSFVIWQKLTKFHYHAVYFWSYSVKYVLCFILRYLMTSWYLNTWKVKIWLSQERKELLNWNKKTFFLVSQVLCFRHTKQTSKNVANATFKDPQNLIKGIQNKSCWPLDIFSITTF